MNTIIKYLRIKDELNIYRLLIVKRKGTQKEKFLLNISILRKKIFIKNVALLKFGFASFWKLIDNTINNKRRWMIL
ncbi:MAG TPA: hypothetical protein VK590_12685 [Saprospiraceae bacterium]|nr:hypothetical protein [Saprospiraceae bacterium]